MANQVEMRCAKQNAGKIAIRRVHLGAQIILDRDERMEGFIDVCKALWSSVAADAFVWDRESGVVAEPGKVRPINHAGRFFKVRGPLNAVPSPQGRPVLIQAGSSSRGTEG